MQEFQMEHLILWDISKTVGLNVPNMAKIGLGNIPREVPLKTVPAESNPTGYATKLQEVSLGKDTHDWSLGNHGAQHYQNLLIPSGMVSLKKLLQKIEEFSGRKVIPRS